MQGTNLLPAFHFIDFAQQAHHKGIEVGVAIQPQTDPAVLRPAIQYIDHVLIFSGHLGHFGGEANLQLLDKVPLLKKMKSSLEIGWDGGINDTNAYDLAKGGIEVLNSGGFIQKAPNPHDAFYALADAASRAAE